MTNQGEIPKFTQCPAKSVLKAGGEYEAYAGSILGEYIEVEENKKIKMKWKMNNWEKMSLLELNFEPQGSEVVIQLK